MFDENENTPTVDNTSTVVDNMSTTQVQETQQESSQERNFREMRDRQKMLERERDEERRQRIELQAALNKQYQQQQQPVVQKTRLQRDDIPEWGNVEDELADIRAEQRKERERLAFSHAELKIAQQYPDYQKALSEENIQKLMHQEPELWSSISNNPDPYARMVSAMKAVKSSNIYVKEEYIPEKKVAQTNSSKPKAVNSLNPSSGGTGALAQAHAFTGRTWENDREREDFYQMALRRARGL